MTTARSLRVVHTDLATSDPLEAREVLDQVYGARLRVGATRESSWRVSLSQTEAGGINSCDLRMPVDLVFQIAGQDQFTFTTMLDGVVEFDRAKTTDRFARGDVFAAIGPETDGVYHTDHAHAHTINLPAPLMHDVARDVSDRRPAPVRFLSPNPVIGGARRWRQATRFVDGLLADPDVANAPLVIGPAARLLAATALAIFPNNAATEPTTTARDDAHPDTLRRAIAFIDANPDLDVTIADIARAAGVTIRAVQLAFRRQLHSTPTAYLRHVRLHHAHQQLQDATPDDGLTVTRVALDWGFVNPDRFAGYYRAAYGRPPSHTLRT